MSSHTVGFLDKFFPDGTLSLTDSVYDLAVAFRDKARSAHPENDWVVVFDWGDTRRIRYPRDSNHWVDLGAGFDITVVDRGDIPKSAMSVQRTLEFAVKIYPFRLENYPEKLIDADTTATPVRVFLR